MRWQERKGWDILIKAFVEEFGDDPNVRLLIKATPFDARKPQIPQQDFKRCVKVLDAFPAENIELLTDSLSVQELIELYGSADAFVLSSRGEGWGRPFIEAMLCGLPAIGPRWSAHLEYMNQQNSLLVSGCLVPVAAKAIDEWRYFEQQLWFEPSIASLRKCMRTVIENGGPSWQRRQETVRELLSRYSASSIAERLRALFLAIPPDGSSYS
jgi:glycosyltransferase involved in cell wall biosynthesis